jgi:membrane-bound serine protease (ClpP class)
MSMSFHRLLRSVGGAIFACLVFAASVGAADSVVIIPVKEDITQNTVYLIRRGLRQAEQQKAKALVIDMDTHGGSVDATEKILALLKRAPMKTFTYVNTKAYSAGAFIAAGTNRIYMAPGSVIGAATPVMMMPGSGVQELPKSYEEKINSAMRALIRTTAQDKGHNPDVFEAMVDADKGLVVNGTTISPKGKVLTLTNEEAQKTYGKPPKPLLSAGTVKELSELLAREKLDAVETEEIRLTGFEQVARFLTAISPILILLGLLGIYVEMNTPGFGFPGIGAILCFVLVFFGSYLAGLAGWEHLLLLLLGVALLAIEIFLIPGFGVTGIAGIVCVCGALLLMMTERLPGGSWWWPSWEQVQMPLIKLCFSVVGAVIGAYIIGKFLPKTPLWKRMELSPAAVTAPEPLAGVAPQTKLLGEIGVAETQLRPAGKARFAGQLVDVVTQGDLIEKGQRVKVIEAAGARIVVAKA